MIKQKSVNKFLFPKSQQINSLYQQDYHFIKRLIIKMQHQNKIPFESKIDGKTSQRTLMINRQNQRTQLIRRNESHSKSIDSRKKSEGSLQLSRSSSASRRKKQKKRVQLKSSLQFVLQQDDGTQNMKAIIKQKRFFLSKQLQVSVNFISNALLNHQFSQGREEINNFIEMAKMYESKFQPLINLFGSVQKLTVFLQEKLNELRRKQDEQSLIRKNIELGNKQLREGKWRDLEELKIKLMNDKDSKSDLSMGLFIESIILTNNESIEKSKHLNQQIERLNQQLLVEKDKNLKISSFQLLNEKLTSVQNPIYIQPREKQHNLLPKDQNRKSAGMKTRSLQRTRKAQSQKAEMFQKKCIVLQLQMESKQEEINEMNKKVTFLERQLRQALLKIERLQKNSAQKRTQISQINNEDEIQLLQNKMDSLRIQKDQQKEKYLEIIMDKQKLILRLQQKINKRVENNSLVNGMGTTNDLLIMELQQKDCQILKLKKQVINLLESQNTPFFSEMQTQQIKDNPQSMVINQFLSQTKNIQQAIQSQYESQGLKLQTLALLRQKWRQTDKLLKIYRNNYPELKILIYLDKKHQQQLYLSEKVLSLEQKILEIQTQLVRNKQSLLLKNGQEQKQMIGLKQKSCQQWKQVKGEREQEGQMRALDKQQIGRIINQKQKIMSIDKQYSMGIDKKVQVLIHRQVKLQGRIRKLQGEKREYYREIQALRRHIQDCEKEIMILQEEKVQMGLLIEQYRLEMDQYKYEDGGKQPMSGLQTEQLIPFKQIGVNPLSSMNQRYDESRIRGDIREIEQKVNMLLKEKLKLTQQLSQLRQHISQQQSKHEEQLNRTHKLISNLQKQASTISQQRQQLLLQIQHRQQLYRKDKLLYNRDKQHYQQLLNSKQQHYQQLVYSRQKQIQQLNSKIQDDKQIYNKLIRQYQLFRQRHNQELLSLNCIIESLKGKQRQRQRQGEQYTNANTDKLQEKYSQLLTNRQQQNIKLKQKITQLQSQLSNMSILKKEQLSNLKHKYTQLFQQQEIYRKQQQQQLIKQIQGKLIKQIKERDKLIQQKDDRYEEYRRQRQQQQQQMSKQMSKLNNIIQKITVQLKQYKDQLKQYKDQLKQYKDQNNKLKNKLYQQQQQILKYNQSVNTLNQQINKLNQQLSSTVTLLQQSNIQINQLQQQISNTQLIQKMQTLKDMQKISTIIDVQNSLITKDVQQDKINYYQQIETKYQNQINTLSKQNKILQQQKTQLQQNCQSIRQQNKLYQEKISQLQYDISQLQSRVSKLQSEQRRVRQERRVLVLQKEMMGKNILNMQRDVLRYKERVKQLTHQKDKLQEQTLIMKQSVDRQKQSNINRLQEQVNRQRQIHQNTIKQSKQFIYELRGQNQSLKHRLNKLQNQLKDKQLFIIQQGSRYKLMVAKLKNEQETHQLIYANHKHQLNNQIQRLKQQNNKLSTEIQLKNNQLLIQNNQLQSYHSVIQEKQKELISTIKEKQQLYSLKPQLKQIKQIKSNKPTIHPNISLKPIQMRQGQQVQPLLGQYHQIELQTLNKQLNSALLSLTKSQSNKNQLLINLDILQSENNNLLNQLSQLKNQLNQWKSQLNQLKSYTLQLQNKLQLKINENISLVKQKIDIQMTLKENQRKYKYQLLTLKAQINSSNKIIDSINKQNDSLNKLNQQLSSRIHSLQRQVEQINRLPISPSTTMAQVYPSNTTMSKVQNLQNKQRLEYEIKNNNKQVQLKQEEITSLKRELNKTQKEITLLKTQTQYLSKQLQLKSKQLQLKSKQLQLKSKQLQLKHKQINQLKTLNLNKNQQFFSIKTQLQSITINYQQTKIQNQILLQKQKNLQIQVQRLTNSQRVLDNELIQYRSRLQNLSESLKLQKCISQTLRTQLFKLKQTSQSFKNNNQNSNNNNAKCLIDSNDDEHLSTLLQKVRDQNSKLNDECRMLREFNTQLQRDLSQLKQQIQFYFDQNQYKSQHINYLTKQLQLLKQQNSNLSQQLLNNNQQNPLNPLGVQEMNEEQYSLLVAVESKVKSLLEQNNLLKQKLNYQIIHIPKDTLNYQKHSHLNYPIKYLNHSVKQLINDVFSFAIQSRLIDCNQMDIVQLKRQLQGDFDKYQISHQKALFILKQLIIKCCNNHHIKGSNHNVDFSNSYQLKQTINRYEWSLQKIKSLLKQYFYNQDPNALQSLKNLSNS